MLIYNKITCYLFPDIGCSKPKGYLICALVFAGILFQFTTIYKNEIRNAPNYNVINSEILKGAQPIQHYGWNGSVSSPTNTVITRNKVMIFGTGSPFNIQHKQIESLLDGNGTTKRLPNCIMIGVNKA